MPTLKRLTVIQARMGSTRLPGKVLQKVGDRTILEWVIYRTQQANLGPLLVTTTYEPADDQIHQLCKTIGITCFRGKQHDVLDRYHRAAECQAALNIIRITADCPLLCPTLLTQTVQLHDRLHTDYTAVADAPTGLGQEIITSHALHEAWTHARGPHHREHVVTYTIDRPETYPAAYLKPPLFLRRRNHWRLTIDTPDDLRLLRRLYQRSGGRLFKYDNRQIIDTIERDPECLELATK